MVHELSIDVLFSLCNRIFTKKGAAEFFFRRQSIIKDYEYLRRTKRIPSSSILQVSLGLAIGESLGTVPSRFCSVLLVRLLGTVKKSFRRRGSDDPLSHAAFLIGLQARSSQACDTGYDVRTLVIVDKEGVCRWI